MARIPKYKAKYVYWDVDQRIVRSIHDIEVFRCHGKLKLPPNIIRFDSQHEFKVYLELVRLFSAERIERQYKVQIASPTYCYPSGRHWKIDFAITKASKPDNYAYYFEAKGAVLPEFTHTLATFESHNPTSFNRLYLVFPNEIPLENKVIKALSKSPCLDRLLTLEQLKQISRFP